VGVFCKYHNDKIPVIFFAILLCQKSFQGILSEYDGVVVSYICLADLPKINEPNEKVHTISRNHLVNHTNADVTKRETPTAD
jgi:hypothetical protein